MGSVKKNRLHRQQAPKKRGIIYIDSCRIDTVKCSIAKGLVQILSEEYIGKYNVFKLCIEHQKLPSTKITPLYTVCFYSPTYFEFCKWPSNLKNYYE